MIIRRGAVECGVGVLAGVRRPGSGVGFARMVAGGEQGLAESGSWPRQVALARALALQSETAVFESLIYFNFIAFAL